MSKNYDNWERLVGAVLLKEELRRLALCHSREPSSVSSGSSSRFSFSSISPFDDQEVLLVHNLELVKESLSRLGLPRVLSNDELRSMEWTHSENEISEWIKAANATIQILFQCERRLRDYADLSSMEVIRGSIIQLLNFADVVAKGGEAVPKRLFNLLDVYETLRDLIPKFELIISDQYCVSLRNEAITIWKRLGKVIRGMFMVLENLMPKDSAKAPVPGGGLHPVTRYVMNYLHVACQSRLTLEQVFEDSVGNLDYREGDDSSSSPLLLQIARIMVWLDNSLEAKSKIYKDPALSSVFMMNNGRYIVEKVKDNELGTLLGDDWIRKHAAKVRWYLANYYRSSWSKVLGVLKVDNFNSTSERVQIFTTNKFESPKEASKSLKEKLSLFNSYFEEICANQASWVTFKEQLREELRIYVLGTLSPAYRNFITTLRLVPDIGNIKYSVEDVEARVSELFQGGS